jgi:alpha-L-fucosidase
MSSHDLPRPTLLQAAWQDMEMAAFAHFGPNAFTDREWGDGTEDPWVFDPSELDADQWVSACRSAGFGMVVVTAKHHDGFCLWPSAQTDHSVKASPWRGGRGDVVKEVSLACRRGGLKFGVYLSPWDRHEASYGSPRYNRHFLAQLEELLTGYGPISEVWFDGACGEGPNGKRQEYDWDAYYRLVRKLQPGALIAICGPDIRWVGNERGIAREDEASTQEVPEDDESPLRRHQVLWQGGRSVWWPAECDVSIRPGWFHHGSENGKVKTLEELKEIYYASVGRNANLLLNVPPDARGLLHEEDVARLRQFGKWTKRFTRSIAETSGAGKQLVLDLPKPSIIDHVVIQEDISTGERIREFALDGRCSGWRRLADGCVVGHKRILRFQEIEASKVRLTVRRARGRPQIRRLAVFAPA